MSCLRLLAGAAILLATTQVALGQSACPDGRHVRFEGGRWTILTSDDRPAPDIAFTYVRLVCNGPSFVGLDGKWGLVSIDGKLVADRFFDRVDTFHEGIAAAVGNGLFAFIGEDGSLLGPLKLTRGVMTSGSGEYSVEFEEGYKKLDRALLSELIRDPAVLTRPLPPRWPWFEGLAGQLDEKTGKWGFVDVTRKFVIAPQFDAVGRFWNGAAWAAFPARHEWCLIDKTGNIKPDTSCGCFQPLVQPYAPWPDDGPRSDVECYDDGLRIIREVPVLRGMAP